MISLKAAQNPEGLITTDPRPKPLPRRSTLSRKRDEDDGLVPSSPSKKARVSFEPDVEVRMLSALDESPDLIQREVRRALEKRKWGDYSDYERLKEIYNPPEGPNGPPSPELIRSHTLALLCNASELNKDTADLVRLVLNSNWLGMPDDYVSLFVRLLAQILSSQGMFLGDTFRMLVQNLTLNPPSSGKTLDLAPIPRSAVYARVHRCLQYLLQLLPPASRVLSALLASSFPYHTESGRAHTVYVKNLLRLAEYVPELKAHILNTITDRIVKIDVQVQVDLEELTDDEGESLIDKIPHIRPGLLDDMDDGDAADDGSEDEDEPNEDTLRTKEIMANVEKVDAVLDVLFTYYDHEFSNNASDQGTTVIDVFLSQFVTIILPTHRSRHTQFLLFHFVQRSPTHIDIFVGACIQIAFDRKQPALVRQASAAYLASFVARGIHVPSNIVRDVFDYIGTELTKLRREYEPLSKGPDLRRYASYYSLVQALLYIFCFRWRELEVKAEEEDEDEDDGLMPAYGHLHQWVPGVKETLSVNVFSKLNPLKVCSPAIVTEFARVAHRLSALYVYHLLETNKRITLPRHPAGIASSSTFTDPSRETALSMSADEDHLHLDEYFPFDPYHLPQSKRWIEGYYRAWEGIPEIDDGLESDSQSDGGDAGASDLEEGTETDRTGLST